MAQGVQHLSSKHKVLSAIPCTDRKKQTNPQSHAYQHMPEIPVHRRLRKEDSEFETRLGYTARPCHKNVRKKKKEPTHVKDSFKM
jgi:hypothetical protein